MKTVVLLSFMLLGFNLLGSEVCGWLSRVSIDDYRASTNFKLVVYNSHNTPSTVIVKDETAIQSVYQFLNGEKWRFHDEINWYWKEKKEKFWVCFTGSDTVRKKVGTQFSYFVASLEKLVFHAQNPQGDVVFSWPLPKEQVDPCAEYAESAIYSFRATNLHKIVSCVLDSTEKPLIINEDLLYNGLKLSHYTVKIINASGHDPEFYGVVLDPTTCNVRAIYLKAAQ